MRLKPTGLDVISFIIPLAVCPETGTPLCTAGHGGRVTIGDYEMMRSNQFKSKTDLLMWQRP
jgi:hypothetical protein